jgi:hypothetical protein
VIGAHPRSADAGDLLHGVVADLADVALAAVVELAAVGRSVHVHVMLERAERVLDGTERGIERVAVGAGVEALVAAVMESPPIETRGRLPARSVAAPDHDRCRGQHDHH